MIELKKLKIEQNSSFSYQLQLYNHLKEFIEESIRVGNNKLPGEMELVASSKLSRDTVRKALAKLEKEGAIVRQKGRGTYITDGFRKDSKTGTIGFIATSMTNSFNTKIISSITQTLAESNYSLLLESGGNSLDTESRAIEIMIEKKVDAIFYLPSQRELKNNTILSVLQRAQLEGIPIIFIDKVPAVSKATFYNGNVIMSDNSGGAMKAVDFLIGKGHKQIALITAPSANISYRERERAYENVMELYNLEPLVYNASIGEDNNIECIVSDILKRGDVTALFGTNDELIFHVGKELMKRGKSLPEDFSAIGFGNLDNPFAPFPLTTVEQYPEEIGKAAVKRLLTLLDTPKNNTEKIIINTELIQKGSVRKLDQ